MNEDNSQDYIIEKVFNHNTILCKSKTNQERHIFFGKGIGFDKKIGQAFDMLPAIENNMMVLDRQQTKVYHSLINQIQNDKLAPIVQTIVLEASRFFDGTINPQLHISLLDHLNFAIDRHRFGIDITYPFLEDISSIYPNEYAFAVKALDFINSCLDVEFPDHELGFLVLHFHAAITNEKLSSIILQKQIFYELLDIIQHELGAPINPQSLYYNRLLVHIDYAIKRCNQNIVVENVLLESIKQCAPQDYALSKHIQKHLVEKYNIDLNDNELGYIALHVHNLRNKHISGG